MHTAMSLAFALAAATGERPAAEATVPPQFRGEWNAQLEHCGSALNDSRLVIGADRFRFYESGGPVRAVVPRGSFEMTVIVELSGEGKSWDAPFKFNLSSDGSQLMDVTDDTPFVRYRCPSR